MQLEKDCSIRRTKAGETLDVAKVCVFVCVCKAPHPPRPMHSDINYPPLYSNKANSRGAAALSETLAEHLPA